MGKPTTIRCYDYVNHSYEEVCEKLSNNCNEVFHDATSSAETRAENVAAGLHVKIAGIDFGKEVLIEVKEFVEEEDNFKKEMKIELAWKASSHPQLFPVMTATLHVYPITPTETQLDFRGEYDPPLGIVGKVIDSAVGSKIAEVSVHHFVSEVADYLRNTID